MLAVSPLRSGCGSNDEREEENDRFSIGGDEFSCGSLLDSIDFDDIFIGIGDGDVLPDLLAEFSVSTAGEESEKAEQENHRGGSSGGSISNSNLNYSTSTTTHQGEEIASQRDDFDDNESVKASNYSVGKEGSDVHKGRKSSSQQNKASSQGNKRKVKVDWTPELHRRFVQAVEQLGMDKAVPSRILELMGIDCLTRHNIASHLQKYRSHQKHLRAREAEAASWNQRRQMYSGGTTMTKMMRSISDHHQHHMMMCNNPWITPTMGFPPQPFTARPLHVWGHPTNDHQPLMMHIWPKHLPHHHSPPLPQQPWAPPPAAPAPSPPVDPSYWHLHHQRVPNNALTPGTPCFPQTLAPRFPGPPVPGIPPHAMYKVDHQQQQSIGVPSAGPSELHPPFDHFHPSKESIDAAIGDVLSKPLLPLPLGLKPPSLDSVLVELQRQGVPKIPPATTATA